MALFEQVKEIIVQELSVPEEKVKDSSTFESDLRADSLDVVELVMELEEKFDIEIPEDDFEQIKSVGDLVRYIEGKVEVEE
ncbi:MAG TPA: acyl carrier protein [Armatimonadota bacterium]|nr:acyl carrier protein [Armatimonadota bacterium]